MDQIEDEKFNVKRIAQDVLDAGAEFLACSLWCAACSGTVFGIPS
jgi:hypothetical protein